MDVRGGVSFGRGVCRFHNIVRLLKDLSCTSL